MKKTINYFEREGSEMLRQGEKLHRALTHLKYEGKLTHKKNLKEVKESAAVLGILLKRHQVLQEKVIFPYLSNHFPRYEATVHFLESEHEEMDRYRDKLMKGVLKFSRNASLLNAGKLYESGIFLVSLLRHHLTFEFRNIRALLGKELRVDEKSEIKTRIGKWLKKYALVVT